MNIQEIKQQIKKSFNDEVNLRQERIEIAENIMNPDNLKGFPDKVKVGKIDFEYGDGSAYNAFPIKENI